MLSVEKVHYAECHYAECRYSECRGAQSTATTVVNYNHNMLMVQATSFSS
jgi:hypothetical protein